MRFLPSPEPPSGHPDAERPAWRWLLFASCAMAALGATRPWIRVRFDSLFGEHFGPPAWQSPVGFTCLFTSLLVGVMALAETGSNLSRQAVRPGSLLLVAVAAVSLLFAWQSGPGDWRGVTAEWTPWFYLACAGVPALLAACAVRWTVIARDDS